MLRAQQTPSSEGLLRVQAQLTEAKEALEMESVRTLAAIQAEEQAEARAASASEAAKAERMRADAAELRADGERARADRAEAEGMHALREAKSERRAAEATQNEVAELRDRVDDLKSTAVSLQTRAKDAERVAAEESRVALLAERKTKQNLSRVTEAEAELKQQLAAAEAAREKNTRFRAEVAEAKQEAQAAREQGVAAMAAAEEERVRANAAEMRGAEDHAKAEAAEKRMVEAQMNVKTAQSQISLLEALKEQKIAEIGELKEINNWLHEQQGGRLKGDHRSANMLGNIKVVARIMFNWKLGNKLKAVLTWVAKAKYFHELGTDTQQVLEQAEVGEQTTPAHFPVEARMSPIGSPQKIAFREQAKAEKASSKVEFLEAMCEQKITEISELRQQNENLSEALSRNDLICQELKVKESAAESHINDLEAELASAKISAQLSGLVTQLEADLSDVKAELEVKKETEGLNSTKLAEAQGRVVKLSQDLEESQQQRRKDAAQHRTERQEQAALVHQLEMELNLLKDAAGKHATLLSDALSNLEELEKKLHLSETQLADVTAQRDTSREAYALTAAEEASKVAAADQKLDEMCKQLAAIQDHAEETSARHELEKQQLAATMGGLETELVSSQAELGSLREAATGDAAQLAGAQGKVAALEEQLRFSQMQHTESTSQREAEKKAHEEALDELVGVLASTRAELQEIELAREAQSAQAQGTVGDLEARLSESQLALQQASAKIESLNEELAERVDEGKAELVFTTAELDALKVTASRDAVALSEARVQLTERETRLSGAHTQLEELTSQREAERREHSRALAQLRHQLDCSLDEIEVADARAREGVAYGQNQDAKIAELEQKLDEAQSQTRLVITQHEVDEQENAKTIQRLQDEYAEAEAEAASRAGERLDGMQGEVADLEARLTESQNMQQQAVAHNESLKEDHVTRLREVETELVSTQKELELLKVVADGDASRLAAADQKLDEMCKQLAAIQDHAEETSARHELEKQQLAATMGGLETELASSEAELGSLREAATGDAAQLAGAQGKVAALEEQLRFSQMQHTESTSQREAEKKAHEEALDELVGVLASTRAELQAADATSSESAGRLSEAQAKASELNQKLSTAENEILQYAAQMEFTKQEHVDKVGFYETELKIARAESSAMRQAAAEEASKVAAADQKLDEMCKQLAAIQDHAEETSARHELEKQQLAATMGGLETELVSSQAELDAVQNVAEALEGLQDIEGQLVASQAENAEMSALLESKQQAHAAAVLDLEADLAGVNAENQMLTEAFTREAAQTAELNEQLSNAQEQLAAEKQKHRERVDQLEAQVASTHRVDLAEAEVQRSALREQHYQDRITVLEKRLSKSCAVQEQLAAQVEAEKELSRAEAVREMELQLARAVREVETLKERAANDSGQMAEALVDTQGRVTALEEELVGEKDELWEVLSQLEACKHEHSEAVNNLNAELADAKAEIESLRSKESREATQLAETLRRADVMTKSQILISRDVAAEQRGSQRQRQAYLEQEIEPFGDFEMFDSRAGKPRTC